MYKQLTIEQAYTELSQIVVMLQKIKDEPTVTSVNQKLLAAMDELSTVINAGQEYLEERR